MMTRQTAIVIEGESCSHGEEPAVTVNLFPNGKDQDGKNGEEVDGFGGLFATNQLTTDQTKLLTSLLGTESPRRVRRSVNFSADS
jgi:hypothetical protein